MENYGIKKRKWQKGVGNSKICPKIFNHTFLVFLFINYYTWNEGNTCLGFLKKSTERKIFRVFLSFVLFVLKLWDFSLLIKTFFIFLFSSGHFFDLLFSSVYFYLLLSSSI